MACVVVYLVLATVADLHAWTAGAASHLQSGGGIGDVGQSVWSLGFTPSSLLHGRGILATDWLNAPWGYNQMANTSIILPALLLGPVTLTLGPVVAFNLAVVLAFAGSATVTMLVIRRYITWLPAAFVGGLLAGFSPAMAAQGSVHLHLIIEVIPPLMWLALDEILIRQRRNPWLLGVGLGLLGAAQLLISAEVLVTTVLLAVVGIIALGLVRRHDVAAHLSAAWRSLVAAGSTFVFVAGYPMWVLLRGPWSVTGPVQSPSYSRQLASDLLSFVLPTSDQLIAPHRATRITDRLLAGNLGENGSYLGIVLIGLLAVIAWQWRRQLIIQIAVIVGSAAAVLSLGASLHLRGHPLHLPLPFALVARTPLLDSASASRFAIPVGLAAGIVLAVGLDRLRAEGFSSRLAPGPSAGRFGLVLAAASLIWLLPAWPYPSAATAIPAYFTNGDSASIPPGSTVLTYPTPQVKTPHDQAMVWQVIDHVNWRLVGSYGHTPGPNGRADNGTAPDLIPALLDFCTTGASPPVVTGLRARQIRAQLMDWNVATIVLTDRSPGLACAESIFHAALGRPPAHIDDVLVYRHLEADLAR